MITRNCRVRACRVVSWVALLAAVAVSSPGLLAQDPNVCDEPGDYPDVIVGDLYQINNYGRVGSLYGYSVGTISCNVGTCWLNWIASTPDHPVIAQNLYRFKNGRITQIGQSWLKHGFTALSQSLCSLNCVGTNGSHLGVNCSDPYSASLNGQQTRLGPKFEVNPATGEFPYPPTDYSLTGDAIYKRLQVHQDDLNPALNAGARYFVEGIYVAKDDAAAARNDNNASYREVTVSPTTFNLTLIGDTKRTLSGIESWKVNGTNIALSEFRFPADGRFLVGSSPIDLGDGFFRYEFAASNMSSHVAARAFAVPVPGGSTVRNIGFHDVAYHSGEPFDGTDWMAAHDQINNRVIWQTQTFDENPNANALRWGTMYNFWFEVNVGPALGRPHLEPFRPGAGQPVIQGDIWVPDACNDNGQCDPGEDCSNCLADCINDLPPTGSCGDGICEIALGEDCTNCGDCNGVQNGNPANRFCCGAGGGSNPVTCSDPRCTSGGFDCGSTADMTCCGDGTCESPEDICSCSADCGAPPSAESTCDDVIDNDCDGQSDCNDLDCCTAAQCVTGVDADSDGISDCDCDDDNNQVWAIPGEAEDLVLGRDEVLGAVLDWAPPLQQGGLALTYETVRSQDPHDFAIFAGCVGDSDPSDTSNSDGEVPLPGDLFLYLVRAANACGRGTLGWDSANVEHLGAPCP